MKIIVLMSQMIGSHVSSGGDRLTVEIVKRWAQIHNVGVVCPEAVVPDMLRELSDQFFAQVIWGIRERAYLHFFIVPIMYLVRAIQTWWFLRGERGDVLVLSGDFLCNSIPAFLCRRNFKIVAVNIYHLNAPPHRRKANPFFASLFSFLMQRFSLWVLRHCADCVMLLNSDTSDHLFKIGFRPETLHVTGGGIDIDAIATAKPSLERYDMVFVGRINPTKGVNDLVDIYDRVRASCPARPPTMIVIGEDNTQYAANIKHALIKSALDGMSGAYISFPGYVSYEKLYGVLKSSKVFVSPSYEEGWGMAVSEALAAGMPVVAYDLPVYRESIPVGLPFFPVPIGDRKKFSEMVTLLLTPGMLHCPTIQRDMVSYEELAKRQMDCIIKTLERS